MQHRLVAIDPTLSDALYLIGDDLLRRLATAIIIDDTNERNRFVDRVDSHAAGLVARSTSGGKRRINELRARRELISRLSSADEIAKFLQSVTG